MRQNGKKDLNEQVGKSKKNSSLRVLLLLFPDRIELRLYCLKVNTIGVQKGVFITLRAEKYRKVSVVNDDSHIRE